MVGCRPRVRSSAEQPRARRGEPFGLLRPELVLLADCLCEAPHRAARADLCSTADNPRFYDALRATLLSLQTVERPVFVFAYEERNAGAEGAFVQQMAHELGGYVLEELSTECAMDSGNRAVVTLLRPGPL